MSTNQIHRKPAAAQPAANGFSRYKDRVLVSKARIAYVLGDLHGDYRSFHKAKFLFEKAEPDAVQLFLGDYPNRGSRGLEIITDLNSMLGGRIGGLKGNHEAFTQDRKPCVDRCNLISEAETKYGSWPRFHDEVMVPFIAKLGVAAIINKVLFVHGGIASFIRTRNDLANPENEHYLLWNDPSSAPGEHRNPGRSDLAIRFGKDITSEVLDSMRLKLLVRSHEPGKAKDGPHLEHGNRLMTINSSSMYGNPFMLRLDTVNLEYSRIWL